MTRPWGKLLYDYNPTGNWNSPHWAIRQYKEEIVLSHDLCMRTTANWMMSWKEIWDEPKCQGCNDPIPEDIKQHFLLYKL